MNPYFAQIPIDQIDPPEIETRSEIDPDTQKELVASVREKGVRQTIGVTASNGRYIRRWGRRRLMAAKSAGLDSVPALVFPDSRNSLLDAAIENSGRDDLPAYDRGRTLQLLIEEENLSIDKAATAMSMAESTARRYLALVNFFTEDPGETSEIDSSKLTVGQFYSSGALSKEPKLRARVLKRAVDETLTVSETEMLSGAVALAPDDMKNELLGAKVSEKTHSAAAVATAATKRRKTERKKSGVDYGKVPAIADLLKPLGKWTEHLGNIEKALKIGKLAPEGIPFVLKKLQTIKKKLDKTIEYLEENNPHQ